MFACLRSTVLFTFNCRGPTHHEHLTLELAILSEQKTAKIISLLEELRVDHPDIHDRIDDEAAAMSAPTDPRSVLETIKKHKEG